MSLGILDRIWSQFLHLNFNFLAAPWTQEVPLTEQLKFQSGAFSIPHPEKASKCGSCGDSCWLIYNYIYIYIKIIYIYIHICIFVIKEMIAWQHTNRTGVVFLFLKVLLFTTYATVFARLFNQVLERKLGELLVLKILDSKGVWCCRDENLPLPMFEALKHPK